MVAIVKQQPRRVLGIYEKEPRVPKAQRRQEQMHLYGHKTEVYGNKTRCLHCMQTWHCNMHDEVIEMGECPGLALWGQMKYPENRPWQVRAPQVWAAGKLTHPTHRGGLCWFRGFLFCIRCCSISIKDGQCQTTFHSLPWG